MSRKRMKIPLVLLGLAIFLPTVSPSSVDSYQEDLVVDAPWRTIRDYLPVLFFAPDFRESSDTRITHAILSNYDPVSLGGGGRECIT